MASVLFQLPIPLHSIYLHLEATRQTGYSKWMLIHSNAKRTDANPPQGIDLLLDQGNKHMLTQFKVYTSNWISKATYRSNSPQGISLLLDQGNKHMLTQFKAYTSNWISKATYRSNPPQGISLLLDQATRHTKLLVIHLPIVGSGRKTKRFTCFLLQSFGRLFRPHCNMSPAVPSGKYFTVEML